MWRAGMVTEIRLISGIARVEVFGIRSVKGRELTHRVPPRTSGAINE